ncbi:beta strand repeat-containing protein [Methylobacterium sp. Leaf118]|uniref:beta strand repeat-containing protein n=1 Tax=Methylobacterium sp. Leaf118 TaxID=2876562 RepID=UPI001E2E3F4D|nr:calcium-binding protein [Methylobacterium sp. Leaf118]
MATISFANLDQDFWLLALQTTGPFTIDGKSTTSYSYITNSNTDIDLLGSGFTFSGDVPTGGIVSSLNYDLGDDSSDAPELTITGLSVNLADFALVLDPNYSSAGSNNLFWRLVLGGDDTINLGNAAGGGGFFISFAGDGRNLFDAKQFYGGNDTITGNAGPSNPLAAIFGDFVGISGGASVYGGDDTITVTAFEVSGDAETVSGGFLSGGDDTLAAQGGGTVAIFYGDARDITTSNPSTVVGGDDTITLSASSTAYGDVRRSPGVVVGGDDLITGGSGDNMIFGDVEEMTGSGSLVGGDDRLYGGGGNDTIYGDWKTLSDQAGARGGNDYLDGGLGFDTMAGGSGNDTYVVDSAGDVVDESLAGSGGTDTVTSATLSVDLTNITLFKGSIENVTLLGQANLTLTGNGLANLLTGNEGANRIDGGAGADTMVGGAGNDTYLVDNAGDRVTEATGGGRDAVAVGVSYTLAAGQEIEELRVLQSAGDRAVNLTGNSLAQTLTGSTGTNILNGGWGNDVLSGQGGADTFAFNSAIGTGNVDRITDFASDDTIRLSKSIFTTLATGALDPGRFKNITTGTADADDRLLYKQSTGELFYDADGLGSGLKVKVAVLDNKAALTADDVFVV